MGKIDYESYIGQTINELTIVGMNYEKREEDIQLGKKPRNYYDCICSCNKNKVIPMDANKIINNAVNHCKFCFRMKIRKDVTGKKIGRLTVIKLARDIMDKRKNEGKYGTIWYCRCECGNPNLIPVFKENLREGNTTSCGCVHKEAIHDAKFIDLTGQKFGKLTVVKFHGISSGKQTLFECICDCGNVDIIIVQSGNLVTGHSISCGCFTGSKGENEVAEYLVSHNIKFKREKTFKDCLGTGEGRLKYDFYIKAKNTLIEFNGIQHEKFTPMLHSTNDDFLKQVEHDKLKLEYAKANNINMITIWYYDQSKIKEILDDIFGRGESLVG